MSERVSDPSPPPTTYIALIGENNIYLYILFIYYVSTYNQGTNTVLIKHTDYDNGYHRKTDNHRDDNDDYIKMISGNMTRITITIKIMTHIMITLAN